MSHVDILSWNGSVGIVRVIDLENVLISLNLMHTFNQAPFSFKIINHSHSLPSLLFNSRSWQG